MLMHFGTWDTATLFYLNAFAGRSPFTDDLIVFTATYLPFLLVALVGGYLAFSSGTWRRKVFAFLLALAAALIARIGIGSPIRFFFPRPRPFLTYRMHQLIVEHAPSFPSGHALFFSAFSTVAYGMDKRLGIACYVLTAFICAARVAAGIHYPSDMVSGAVLGVAVGLVVNRLGSRYLRA